MSVWCSALQCVVVCCFVLVCCGALQLSIAKSGLKSEIHVCELNVLQCVAVNILWCIAVCCYAIQCVLFSSFTVYV